MLGFKRNDARSDLLSGGGRKSKKAQAKNPKKAPQPSKSEEEEEWTGFGSKLNAPSIIIGHSQVTLNQ